MNEIREGFTCFIGLANSEAVRHACNSPEIMKIYTSSLFNGYGKIKTYIKPFYKIDNELLTALDKLYNSILCALNGGENSPTEIDDLSKDFADKYLVYDWAYWKYIQRQKEGNYEQRRRV